MELGEIDIADVHVAYDNKITAIDSKLDLGHLLIQFNELDLPGQLIDVSKVSLDNFNGHFALGEAAQQAVVATSEEVAAVMEKAGQSM